MANLRVDKITSTETFETTGSVQFDGTGDYLSLANIADFRMGSDDFTVECWVYPVSSGANEGIVGIWEASSGRTWLIYLSSAVKPVFILDGDGSGGGEASASGPDALPLDTWTHLAGVRHGDYITLYVNGTSVAKVGAVTVYNNTSDPLEIGRFNSANEFEGHISNVRVVKGKALYTSNFKPSMRELEVVPGTVLLACQSKTDAALEKTGKTTTANGNAVACELTPGLLTPIVKSGGGSAITGSVEFTGSGDYLEVDLSDDAIGTDEFTIEMWINPGETSFTATNRRLIRIGPNNNANNIQVLYNVGNSNFEVDNGANELINPGITTVATQSWSHIALTRQGTNNLKLFVNGVEDTATTTSADISQTIVQIGNDSTLSNLGLIGFISNLRVVKGTALYTDDFIPPTRELKRVPGTVLLCCQDPDNPLTEATGKTITGHGSLDTDTSGENLITNGNFTTSASDGWTVVEGTGSTALGTAQSGTFNDGNHLVLTATSGSFVFLAQQFTTKIGSTYLVNLQSNGSDESFISTDSDKDNAIITDIRNSGGNNRIGDKTFVATQTSYHMILRGGTGGGNFDTASVYKVLTPKGASNFTPQVGDDRKVTFEGVTKINSNAYFYLPTGDTVTRDSRYGRGLFALGAAPTATNTINYVTISSMGNSQDFGDLTYTQDSSSGGCSSSTRGVFGGGGPSNRDTICFVTIATTGDAVDFGNLTEARRGTTAHSNSTRGIFTAGRADPGGANPVDNIDFITIASTGNAIDFGNLTVARRYPGSTSSPIRGVVAGGFDSSGRVDVMDYITISSTGNAADFGNLSAIRVNLEGNSDGVRGVFGAGDNGSDNLNTIEYITISSTGNAQDFGDLVNTVFDPMAASNSIRGLYAGGGDPAQVNVIQYITIASTGNANDFGDLTSAGREGSGCSDSHGGLG
jgi:hypothetical protein